MGNGALPHGPSYRAHPRLYLGVFHCGAQNFDAIGGTTDIDKPPAPIASEAYDQTPSGHHAREDHDVGLIRKVKPYFSKIIFAAFERMKAM